MRELPTDAREVVLLLELEDADLQVLRYIFSHFLSFNALSHLIFVDKAKHTGQTVTVAPYLCFGCLILVVVLQNRLVRGKVGVGQHFPFLQAEACRHVPLLHLPVISNFIFIVANLLFFGERLRPWLFGFFHYCEFGELRNPASKRIQLPYLLLQFQLIFFVGLEFPCLLATDQVQLFVVVLVGLAKVVETGLDSGPLKFSDIVILFLLLLLIFAGIVLIVGLPESLLQLDEVRVLFLLEFAAFCGIPLQCLEFLLELSNFLFERGLELFCLFVLQDLQLLLLLLPQAGLILQLALVIFDGCVFGFHFGLKVVDSGSQWVYLSVWSRGASLALSPCTISRYMSICLQALLSSFLMLSICLLLAEGELLREALRPPFNFCLAIFFVSYSFCCLRASMSSRLICVSLLILRSFSTSSRVPSTDSRWFLSSRTLLLITQIYMIMRRMPPLPNRKQPPATGKPFIELVSNRLPIPQRYNSIERVRESQKDLTEEQEERGDIRVRKNYLIRRPISARQLSEKRDNSKDSIRSRDSRGSMQKGRQSPHYNKKMRMSMPSVSAQSWVLYEMREERFLTGRSNFKRREIASLTKMMNLITILQLCEATGVQPQKLRVTVTRDATALNGTTAELRFGMELSLEDLLFGMMLPSGNDAAHLIAQVGGVILRMIKEGELDRQALYSCEALGRLIAADENGVGHFLHQMNATSRKIGMSRSSWANPHGLSNCNNLSTAEDVAKLAMYCMKNNKFREVVSTKFYSCAYFHEVDGTIEKGWHKWENTNKMLWQGWDGIKTGITPNAGPCLAASTTRSISGRDYEFLVVLLCSESMEARWKEVKELVEWIVADPSLL